MERIISQQLKDMGISNRYKGRSSVIRAVELIKEDENCLLNVVNEIYRTIGEAQGIEWTAVERQINTVVNVAWRTNSKALVNIAGYPLTKPPTPSQFIEMLYNYAQQQLEDE